LKKQDEFQFLHISLLREYLDLEFRSALLSAEAKVPLTFPYDLERLIDDWVILAFFVGNDFLPHLPTLDIGEGGLDTLLAIYKEELPQMDGYIFERRQIQWGRLERITRRMGELEEAVFAERQENAVEFARKQKRKSAREQQRSIIEVREDELFDGEELKSPSPDEEELMKGIAASLADIEAAKKAELEAAAAAPKIFDSQLSMLMRAHDAPVQRDEATGAVLDYESLSFKARYYREKYPEWFDRGLAKARDSSQGADAKIFLGSAEQVRLLVQNYAQGLKWVAAYYYEGCRSWKWSVTAGCIRAKNDWHANIQLTPIPGLL
jgi:5'-3' exonuclease